MRLSGSTAAYAMISMRSLSKYSQLGTQCIPLESTHSLSVPFKDGGGFSLAEFCTLMISPRSVQSNSESTLGFIGFIMSDCNFQTGLELILEFRVRAKSVGISTHMLQSSERCSVAY